MATLRTGQTTDFSNQGTEFEVDSFDTDGAEISETYYIPEFAKWNGYYRKIAELRSVINKFGSWTFGRGIKADSANEKKLKRIKGIGKESARSVLKNCWRVAMICGDSFAHKIKGGNLKPLNPGKVAIVANAEGIIIAYEQRLDGDKAIRYDPDEIYHLSYEREADEIHGIPFPEALEELIISKNEAIGDLRVLYHRTVKPILFYQAETDDTAKLNSLEDTINKAFKNTESVILPFGVIKEIKRASSPQFSTGEINSLAYIKFLVRTLVTSTGMPEVVMGWGESTTEASANIIYLSYQQEIEDMQLYNQEAADIQLEITFNLEFPASIETMLQQDKEKDGPVKAEKPQAGKDT